MTEVNDNWALGKPFGLFHHTGFDYDVGEVATPYGFVTAYAQGGNGHRPLTELRMCFGGRVYTRTFDGKRYSQRYIVTLARRFAEDVVAASA